MGNISKDYISISCCTRKANLKLNSRSLRKRITFCADTKASLLSPFTPDVNLSQFTAALMSPFT